MSLTYTVADLSEEQRQTLIDFALGHGRTWKRRLRSLWMKGTDQGYLRQIRNQFGPEWLTKLKPMSPPQKR